MIAENPLIHEARAALKGQELLSPEQDQAKALCAQSYTVAAELLNNRGRVERSWNTRALTALMAAIPILGQVALIWSEVSARKSGYHTWETGDKVVWSTSVNDGEGIKVDLASSISSRNSVTVRVQGLHERLDISNDGGFLSGAYEYDFHHRRPSLEEAQKWQQLVTGLQGT